MNIGRWGCLAALLLAVSSPGAWAQLSLEPANPTPLDTVRLRYTHIGCTNPDSARISQAANVISVQVDRTFFPDCGMVNGYFEEFTLGRLPSGDYDVQLALNPPPPTLGSTQLVGPVHLTVGALPPTGSAHPHENFADLWWNPRESGWALNVVQSGEKLFLVWVAYETDGSPTWFVVPSGTWVRESADVLRLSGTVYRTHGPPWPGTFDPAAVTLTAVGTAGFMPRGPSRAQFSYTIGGVSGSKEIERLRF
ncbi:MAG: hypothetical protein ACXWAC_17940 [Usitatibacter sp.]